MNSKNRRWLWLFAVFVPIALYSVMAERSSWRPKTLALLKRTPYGIAFSPDGNTLATAEVGGALSLWNVHSRHLLKAIESSRPNAVSVAYAPDGKSVAYGGADVAVWDTQQAKLSYQLQPQQGRVWSTCFSPNGRYVAATHHTPTLPQPLNFLSGWDTGTRKRLWTAPAGTPPTSLVFAQDGSWIGCGDLDDTVRFFAADSGQLLRSFKFERINVPTISPDGRLIAAAPVGRAGAIKLWDAHSGVLKKTLQAPPPLAVNR